MIYDQNIACKGNCRAGGSWTVCQVSGGFFSDPSGKYDRCGSCLLYTSASQKDDETDLPTPDDFYHIGTIGKIKQMLKLPGDSIRVLVEGICRGRIEDVLFEVPYFRCRVRKIEDEPVKEDDAEAEALMRTVLTSFDDYISINQSLAPEVFATVVSINEPGRMADMVA